MASNMKDYLITIENILKASNATEHTYRPTLKALIESFDLNVTATNEPKRIACGAPDYIVTRNQLTIGYIEAKDIGKSLNETERTAQLKRYLQALDNLILTDYLDFRWYVDGNLRQQARLATLQPGGKLKYEKDGLKVVEELLINFLAHRAHAVNTPKELAQRMARITHIIRDTIVAAFETNQTSTLLEGWREAFARVLIPDIALPEKTADFADMFAQTLAYGLFTARVMDTTPDTFTRQEAQYLIPKSNPFLRDFFIQISGPDLNDEPFASFVDDLVNLLAHTDMKAVLANFGHRTGQEDPVVHFYETFLAAYDPKLRETRGVYYTPEPIVSYIVRSVDYLLKTCFNSPDGLADNSTIIVPNRDPGNTVKGTTKTRRTTQNHRILILDPATGTGTFLYAVIDHIRQQFMQQNNAGMWPGYVRNHLLPRLFGFELLMAPYAIAHFKLSLQLAGRDLPSTLATQWAYHSTDDERLGIYLTNALEEAHEMTSLPLFTQWVADETNAANYIKQELPILVVMGNPPYSGHSANKGTWIDGLLKGKLPTGEKVPSYYEVDGQPLGERNPKWLQDDYVKFIRWAQWRIERSGSGVLAFVTNHGYLDNPTFRGMRQSLLNTFTDIYLLNLHGNSKKKENAPDGAKDENVFDIQQGVAIGLFVKEKGKTGKATVHYADLWGMRETVGKKTGKYPWLLAHDVANSEWEKLAPQAPLYLFVPQDMKLASEYNKGWKITEIFQVNTVGIVTGRDRFVLDFEEAALQTRIHKFLDTSLSDIEVKEKFLGTSDNLPIGEVRRTLRNKDWKNNIVTCLYRPFDERVLLYENSVIERSRADVMQYMLANTNMGIIATRQTRDKWDVFTTKSVCGHKSCAAYDINSLFPLYRLPTQQHTLIGVSWPPNEHGLVPNFNPNFVTEMENLLKLRFETQQPLSESNTFGPEDIFYYIYAILRIPTYRARYDELLKIDFPRIPLTSDVDLFRSLCGLGQELAGLHLLESTQIGQLITRYPISGDNHVEKGYPQYAPPQNAQPGYVSINKSQYFEGILPEVWEFHIGGYQVLDKWLKDRQGRQLTYNDLIHYQKIIVAIQKTIELMGKIDKVIPKWPID